MLLPLCFCSTFCTFVSTAFESYRRAYRRLGVADLASYSVYIDVHSVASSMSHRHKHTIKSMLWPWVCSKATSLGIVAENWTFELLGLDHQIQVALSWRDTKPEELIDALRPRETRCLLDPEPSNRESHLGETQNLHRSQTHAYMWSRFLLWSSRNMTYVIASGFGLFFT